MASAKRASSGLGEADGREGAADSEINRAREFAERDVRRRLLDDGDVSGGLDEAEGAELGPEIVIEADASCTTMKSASYGFACTYGGKIVRGSSAWPTLRA